MTNPDATTLTDPTMPTRLTLGDSNEYEVVTAIYVPPLYGDIMPCWITVLRVDVGTFVVTTVASYIGPTGVTYRVEHVSDDLRCPRAHQVAWKRAADRYSLAG